jgi:hypothetical protein
MGRSRSERARTSADIADTADEQQVGRRALLRRAATVAAAGIGGVAATEMLTAGPASAASGDPFTLGQSNSSGADQSKLSSAASAGASLEITHTANIANLRLAPVDTALDYQGTKTVTGKGDAAGVMKGGELLNLTEAVTNTNGSTSQVDTLFWMAGPNADTKLENLAVVLTTATGTVFAPFGPKRVLDTRTASGRTLIAKTSGILDSAGRLIAGKTLELKLDTFVKFAYALHYNLMATQAIGNGGAATVWGSPTRPSATQVHFDKSKPVANSGITPLSTNISVKLFTTVTCHLVLDIQGWTLPDFSFLKTTNGSAAAGFTAAAATGASVLAPRD